MAKIMKLTPKQEAELPRFRQRYLELACNGSRIDRSALEAALADAYAVIGKPAPRLFIFDSPAACMMALKIFEMGGQPIEKISLWGQLWGQLRNQLWDQLGGQLRDQLWGQLWDQLWGQLRNQLGDQLWGQLRGQLWGQLGGQLGGQLWDQLRGQLWGQLWDQLWGQLGDQLWGQLRDQLWDQLRDQLLWNPNFLWGSQDLYWIAWARFAQQIGVKVKPETDHRLGIMERIAEQCEWWWPYENIVVASEKPLSARWDDQARLHCETGAAVEYADSYALYAWHGVRVPEKWITEKAISPQDALTWENMEQRRAACEILGWATILRQLDARTIDKDEDPQIGELIQVSIPDIGKEQFLRVLCGTGREFALPVPPNMKTALEANAWTYGLDADVLRQLEVRT